ncbi:hypothetical protein IV203_003221 [Nitzschia inconspicua]|uniref:Transmembrane protein n=1 Tax=Nitzschia inconspicua TaxID=303405 RepID=A0A9K3L354_9STRA|nr:hypothetical protein IV203_003221 [Nitzschia inconspicua]
MDVGKNTRTHTSPLMAEEGEVTTLGNTTTTTMAMMMMEDEDHQSPLERLIARSTLEAQRGGDVVDFDTMNPVGMMRYNNNNHNSVFGGVGVGMRNFNHPNYESSATTESTAVSRRPSLLTLFAVTGCLLQVGFVWSSFMAPSWFDTHLLLSISLHVINKDTDQLLHSTSLATLLSDLNGANEGMAAMFLIVTALVIPCLFSVAGPLWTWQDRIEQDQLLFQSNSLSLASLARWTRHRSLTYSPRRFLEYIMRISLSIFFLLCIMDVGTSSIEMNNINNTQFTLINQMQGGLACYTIGMTCALVVIVLLRISESNFHDHCWSLLSQQQPTSSDDAFRQSAPPHQAFQLPWNILPSIGGAMMEAQEELEAPLLGISNGSENSTVAATTPSPQDHALSCMQIETGQQGATCDLDSSTGSRLSCWKRAVLYELAIFATVFWIPALFLPLFELSYGGIISDFMTEVTFSVQFWEFPAVLWQRGIAAGTEQWILMLLGLVLVSCVYIIPLLATLLAIGVWVLDPIPSEYCRKVLGALQPCMCGFVFWLALNFALPAFEVITEYAIDMGSSGLCKRFEVITSDTCLSIVGDRKAGVWFLLGQSLSLELFVILTLLWKTKAVSDI